MSAETHAYGPHHHQFGELTLPAAVEAPVPVAVLVHGGTWLADHDLDRLRPAAADLARRGWAAWNVEYRRLGGDSGGGWPQTLEDVSAAIDHLAALRDDGAPLDLGRVVTVGHSAGGHLSLLDAARGAEGRAVRPRAAVGVAPITDLRRAHALGAGETIERLLGGPPDEIPSIYAAASPITLVPLGIPQLLVHGEDDVHVPADTATDHVAAAQGAGDDATFELYPGQDHFDVVEPGTACWAGVLAYLGTVAAR